MAETYTATCIVLGEGPLPLQCMDILKDKGFEILAFISRDLELSGQMNRYDCPFLTSTRQLDPSLHPDYIFSINNGIILKEDLIARAHELVINYHDSPLPKYAGVYATNWALLHQEKKHAVTWHVLDASIDTGDILEQEFIDLTELEPIWSVNMKCFAAALLSFERLIRKIVSGKVKRSPQDLSERSYFPLMERPYHLGLVTPDRSLEELETLQLATQYGSLNDNEFMLPHLFVGKDYYTVTKYALEASEVGKAGTIRLESKKAGFFCKDGLVVPELVFDPNCKEVAFAEVLTKQGLKNGDLLETPANVGQIDKLFADTCKKEMFWKQELAKSEPMPFPFVTAQTANNKRQDLSFDLPFALELKKAFPEEKPELVLLALLSTLMLRINDQETGTLGIQTPTTSGIAKEFGTLIRKELPFNLSAPAGHSAKEVVIQTIGLLKTILQSGTCTVDMPLRYKSLRGVAENDFAVVVGLDLPVQKERNDHSIYLSVQEDKWMASIPGPAFKGSITNFKDTFHTFVTNILEKPDTSFQLIPLIDSRKVVELGKTLNKPSGTAFPMEGILDQFDRMVQRQVNKPALVCGDHVSSYQEMEASILQLAGRLQERGVKPTDTVMICLPRCYRFIIAQFAIMRCGATFLPIDSSMPADRKQFIFEDSNSVLVLTNEQDLNRFPEDKKFYLSKLEASDKPFVPPTHPGSLAYLIYTSGSTGVPKGVRISHKALTCFVSGAIGNYGFQETDRVLQFANLGFDASIEEIFCTLCSGGTLYLRNEEMLNPEVLIQFSIDNALTIWDFPTAFWRQVLATSFEGMFPGSLRTVIIGGEAITNSDFENWKKHPSSACRLFNTYGPTETTVVATVFEVTTDYTLETSIPIGHPLPGYRVFITDKHRNQLPIGLPGELLVAGPALSDGYLNRDEAQQKAFFNLNDSLEVHRCYCTGDLVFSDESGLIHYIGRADGQLKIRGFRVEPGEIENQIMQLGGIKQCVVLGKPTDKGEKQLVAYVVVSNGKNKRTDTLKAECMAVLPNYMVPEHFVELPEIPLTPNGKIDKKQLLAVTLSAKKKKSPNPVSEPLTPLQEKMVNLWREVLEDNTLSLDDDFFENGGHSLRAVRLMASIKKETNVHLPLSSLISCPTPRKMAEILVSEETDTLWKCLVPIRTNGNKRPLYLIHGAGLNVLLYQSLGNHLDPDRPIFALQAKGLDGKSPLSTSIEQMATDYIDEIRKMQPEGPYAIFGFSMGGFIAYEMGRQLLAQHQKVAFLGVIDTVTSFAREELPKVRKLILSAKAFIGKPSFFLYALAREPWTGKVKFVRQKIKNIKNMLLYYASRLGLRNVQSTPKASATDQPVYLSSKASVVIDTALNNYTLRPSSVTLDLFRAGKQMFYIQEPKTYGWSNYAQKGVVVHNVPGEHSELFAPPNDALFAKILTDRLNELEQ